MKPNGLEKLLGNVAVPESPMDMHPNMVKYKIISATHLLFSEHEKLSFEQIYREVRKKLNDEEKETNTRALRMWENITLTGDTGDVKTVDLKPGESFFEKYCDFYFTYISLYLQSSIEIEAIEYKNGFYCKKHSFSKLEQKLGVKVVKNEA